MVRVALALTALAVFVAPAPAAQGALRVETIPPSPGAQALYQSWTDQAARNVPLHDGTLKVHLTDCHGRTLACVEEGQDGEDVVRIPDLSYLFAGEGYRERDREQVRALWLHELAHVVDARTTGPRAYRASFRWAMGYPAADFSLLDPQSDAYGWSVSEPLADGRRVRIWEHFADAWGWCARDPDRRPASAAADSGHGFAPTDEQYRRACWAVSQMRFTGEAGSARERSSGPSLGRGGSAAPITERQLRYRERRHEHYHRRSQRPDRERRRLAAKWHRLVAEARSARA